MCKRILCLMLLCLSWRAAADMVFIGNLLDRACQLDPTLAAQDVVFMQTVLPQFHNAPGKSPAKSFSVKLLNCRAESIGKVVKVIFSDEAE